MNNKHVKKVNLFTASSTQLSGTSGVFISNRFSIERYDNIGLEFIWTAGTSGALFIDASIDFTGPQSLASSAFALVPLIASTSFNFFTWIASSSLNYTNGVPATGTSGLAWYNINQNPFPWMQVRFVPSGVGSTGTMNAWMVAKDI